MKHKIRILSRRKVQSQFFYENFENFQLYQSQESPRKKAPVFFIWSLHSFIKLVHLDAKRD